jgi:hypothetical protein
MILHVSGLDKFIPPFIYFIEENFDSAKHRFWITGDCSKYPYQKNENIYQVNKGKLNQIIGMLHLILQLHRSDKVMLHGLFNIKIVMLLAAMPWLLKKCYWVMWGGDLYAYQLGKRDWKWKLKEFFRRPVIKKMGHLVTYIEGDAELARKWYGARGEYHECLMYLSNIVNPQVLQNVEQTEGTHSGLTILVGNSANPSNNHIEALEKLLPYKDQDIKIYVPLSYGDQDHAKKVIDQGNDWFGEKFFPMTSFMPFDQYLTFLKSIDIAIFNHKRQQAMGNTITLLGLGKTVYMRKGVSHWCFLTSIGLNIKSISKFSLESLPATELSDNAKMVPSYFSRDRLASQLSNIFRS